MAEDNQNDIALTVRALKKCHILNELVIVSDGKEALTYLFSHEELEKPAVAILDLKLPFISGLEILSKIRENENTRNLPVIILSASIDENDRQKSILLGANDFLCKPIDFNEFVKMVSRICEQWL